MVFCHDNREVTKTNTLFTKVDKIVKTTNGLNPDSHLRIPENCCIFIATARDLKEWLGRNENLVTGRHHSAMGRNQTPWGAKRGRQQFDFRCFRAAKLTKES